MAATYTKSEVTVITHQHLTSATTIISSDQDSSNDIFAAVYCYHGRLNVANVNPGSFLIQVSPETSGDESWSTAYKFTPTDDAGGAELLSDGAGEPAGETVLAVASTSGFSRLEYIYISDSGTPANSEWAYISEVVTNTSINIVDGLTNAKDSADLICNKADFFIGELDLLGISRWRVIFSAEDLTQDVGILVLAVVTTGLSE